MIISLCVDNIRFAYCTWNWSVQSVSERKSLHLKLWERVLATGWFVNNRGFWCTFGENVGKSWKKVGFIILFVDERWSKLQFVVFSAQLQITSPVLCRVRQSRRRSNTTTTSHSAQYSEEAAKSRKQPKSWKQWDQRHNSCSLQQKVTGLWVRAQLGDAKLELLCWELGRGLQRRVTTHGAGQLDTAWYSWPHLPLHHTTVESGRTKKQTSPSAICMTWQCSVDIPVTVLCYIVSSFWNEMWLRPSVPATISAMMMIVTVYPDE